MGSSAAGLRARTPQPARAQASGRRRGGGFAGVTVDKCVKGADKSAHKARIRSGTRRIELGRFRTGAEAARSYDLAAYLLHGPGNAVLNFDAPDLAAVSGYAWARDVVHRLGCAGAQLAVQLPNGWAAAGGRGKGAASGTSEGSPSSGSASDQQDEEAEGQQEEHQGAEAPAQGGAAQAQAQAAEQQPPGRAAAGAAPAVTAPMWLPAQPEEGPCPPEAMQSVEATESPRSAPSVAQGTPPAAAAANAAGDAEQHGAETPMPSLQAAHSTGSSRKRSLADAIIAPPAPEADACAATLAAAQGAVGAAPPRKKAALAGAGGGGLHGPCAAPQVWKPGAPALLATGPPAGCGAAVAGPTYVLPGGCAAAPLWGAPGVLALPPLRTPVSAYGAAAGVGPARVARPAGPVALALPVLFAPGGPNAAHLVGLPGKGTLYTLVQGSPQMGGLHMMSGPHTMASSSPPVQHLGMGSFFSGSCQAGSSYCCEGSPPPGSNSYPPPLPRRGSSSSAASCWAPASANAGGGDRHGVARVSSPDDLDTWLAGIGELSVLAMLEDVGA